MGQQERKLLKDQLKDYAKTKDQFTEHVDSEKAGKDIWQAAQGPLTVGTGIGVYLAGKGIHRGYKSIKEKSGVIGKGIKKIQRLGAKISETSKERQTRKANKRLRLPAPSAEWLAKSELEKQDEIDRKNRKISDRDKPKKARKPKVIKFGEITYVPGGSSTNIKPLTTPTKAERSKQKYGGKKTSLGFIKTGQKFDPGKKSKDNIGLRVTRTEMGTPAKHTYYPQTKGKSKQVKSTLYTDATKQEYLYKPTGKKGKAGKQVFDVTTSKSKLIRQASAQQKIIDQGGRSRGGKIFKSPTAVKRAESKLASIQQQAHSRLLTGGKSGGFGSSGRHAKSTIYDAKYGGKPRIESMPQSKKVRPHTSNLPAVTRYSQEALTSPMVRAKHGKSTVLVPQGRQQAQIDQAARSKSEKFSRLAPRITKRLERQGKIPGSATRTALARATSPRKIGGVPAYQSNAARQAAFSLLGKKGKFIKKLIK